MNTNNYLPFDLETALKHPERVVTRDGRKVSELHLFKTYNTTPYNLLAVVDGGMLCCNSEGKFSSKNVGLNYDLFLLPEVKECWVNVYLNDLGKLYVRGVSFEDEYSAKSFAKLDPTNYIKTIRITNEPE